MKSVLIIGIGRFGKHLAVQMAAHRSEVMIVDRDESRVSDIMDLVTSAQIGDCTQQAVLDSLGVRNFDICFVCIGSDFKESLEITLMLKEMGAKRVVSKAGRDIHAKFLLRNGADEVIYPEKDMAKRVAMRMCANHVFDYIEITPDDSIIEIQPPKHWIGHTIGEMRVRTSYGVSILAVKTGPDRISPLPGVGYTFRENEHLLVFGARPDIEKLMNRL